MHPHLTVVDRHFGDLCGDAALIIDESDAAGAPVRQWRSPAGHLRGDLQHVFQPRVMVEHLEPYLERIATGGMGQFVDEAFDDERVPRRPHRPPVSGRHRQVHLHVVDQEVGNAI